MRGTALHAAAVQAVLRPLPRDRPLWRAVLVPDLQDGRLGLVLGLHHVVADEAGAMTLLAQLTDGGTLTVTVTTDPDVVPDVAAPTVAVRAELDALAAA